MAGLIPTYPALLAYEVAFNAAPNQAAIPPWYTDLSARTKTSAQSTQRGRQYELDVNQAGTWNTGLENKDGALDPSNAASPYAPGVVPYRSARIRAVPGVNILTVDQATAGEGSGYPAGPVPAALNVSNDFGYALTLAASGTAYQGNQVYNTVVPAAATQFSTILLVTNIPVIPSTAYAFSAQVRINSGTSTPTSAAIFWFDRNGNSVGTPAGSSVTPTAGSATWNTVSVTATAPTTALSATLKIQIASGGSTSAQTVWQCDGLQWEQSALATLWQQPQTVSPNLLPRAVATATASINLATDSPGNWFYANTGTVTQATGLSPAAATGATTAVAWTTTAGATTSAAFYAGSASSSTSPTGPVADCVQVTAGNNYTFSVYLMRTSTADALTIQPAIAWYDQFGNALTPSTGSAALVFSDHWIRVTAFGIAPAGALWGRPLLQLSSPSPTTVTNVLYATSWQLEQAGGAGPWYDPGPTYQIFGGFIERWPQNWLFNGTYGITGAIGVDALAALAQYTLQAPFIEEILALGANFVYPLNDPAGSSSCVDASGKRPVAPVENSPYGAGSLTFGSPITSTNPGSAFVGTNGPVATFNNNPGNTSSPPAQLAETFVAINKTTVSPGPPPNGNWTRIIHFRCSTAPSGLNAYSIWEALPPTFLAGGNSSAFNIGIPSSPTGSIDLFVGGSTGGGVTNTNTTNYCDGNWHQAAITVDGSGNVAMYMDGAAVPTSAASITLPISGCTSDTIGTSVQYGAQIFRSGLIGDVALAVEIPLAATAAQITNLYNSFRSASSGESSGARAARVLKWIGWTGPTAIDTGQTTSMGPASDLTGATGLDAVNSIALTENGNFFDSSSNVLTFASRTRRYGQHIPVFTFGENAALGEWPYETISFEYDPTHLFNFVQVTHYSSSQVATAQDAASQQNYFPRILQRTINPSAFTEAQDAAAYLLQQYKSPRERVATLTLSPGAIPGLFAALLQLDIGTRVRIMRRPPNAPATQIDGFVEAVGWTIDPVSGGAIVQLQCSPADLSSYWQLAALHTTLSAQANSGQAQATINALPDAAANALVQSLPSGYQLVFDPGTPIQETMTLAPGGIPATTPGYSTATLTFTSNFANTHQSGAVVCEPLPATVTDPTVYDTSSVLGAATCTVKSGGASGTNTITVTALGDGKTNAAGSDWTLGDLLWIGVGTPNFEGYNLCGPNQATAGEGAIPLAAGTAGSGVGITADVGTPTVTASGTAFQGANVWQVSVSGGVATPTGLLYVLKVPATPLLPFTVSAYVRSVTSGANPQVFIYAKFLSATGAFLAQSNGTTTTLTGATGASWTRLTVTGTAPAGTVWVQLGIVLSTAPGSAWTFQADGLQVEQNSSASAFCVTPQVKSVAASVPGYSSVQITLNTNLINNHSQGEVVCDPLPPGVTSPAAVAASARLAY